MAQNNAESTFRAKVASLDEARLAFVTLQRKRCRSSSCG
jgi:hypothetical protein